MILKKQEQDNKVKVIYKSSNILASILETDTKDLTVIFKNGTQYKYAKVGDTDYTRFELAESQGKVLNSHIKKYAYSKLDNVNPEAIIHEINELADAESQVLLKAKQAKLIETMNTLILQSGNDTILSKDKLDILLGELTDLISEHKVEEVA